MTIYYVQAVAAGLGPSPHPIAEGYTTRTLGRRALRAEVRDEAALCRARHGKCGVVKITEDYYELRVGGKQGAHLWTRLVLSEAPRGARVTRVIGRQAPGAAP